MLQQEQIDQFHRDGFLNGGRILNDEAIDELSDALEAILAKGPNGFGEGEPRPVSFRDLGSQGDQPSANPVWQIVNIWEASPPFQRLIYDPAVVEGISQLTGAQDLMVWHDQIQYKPASHGGATRWHQDAPLWPIIRPMTPVSAWIPFDDADEENGCMWMVPGSHTWGNQIDFLRTQHHLDQREHFDHIKGFDTPDGRPVEPCPWPVKKGEVSFHHSLTWHGSPFNHSIRPRRAIAIHYMTGEARFEAGGQHIMKQFVNLEDGAPMAQAGAHFPPVMRAGTALETA
ncbi:MAG: phytanoyl-CoA dioxygenase family protein [Candidatus Latescibacteria bacterium]|nr:phytanoyl-CoA dioxygenase family protein [Candidatus Latescibacterota bacterium]